VKCLPASGTAEFLRPAAVALARCERPGALLADFLLRVFGTRRNIFLCTFDGGGIYFFDRAAKPIFFWSPGGGGAPGASAFIRGVCLVRQRPEKPFGF
jgi:hypothetical protein